MSRNVFSSHIDCIVHHIESTAQVPLAVEHSIHGLCRTIQDAHYFIHAWIYARFPFIAIPTGTRRLIFFFFANQGKVQVMASNFNLSAM